MAYFTKASSCEVQGVKFPHKRMFIVTITASKDLALRWHKKSKDGKKKPGVELLWQCKDGLMSR